MILEWDPDKATSNLSKHGIDFHEGGYVTIGASVAGRMLVVVHTDRGEAVRIISARPATPRERRFYEQGE